MGHGIVMGHCSLPSDVLHATN